MSDATPTRPTPAPADAGEPPLLQVKDLRLRLGPPDSKAFPVDGVTFTLRRGRTLGLVGESGCGKSLTALSLVRLYPDPPMRIHSGQVLLEGRDVLRLPPSQLRQVRGDRVGMVFQEPATSLNPVLTCGEQIAESLRAHRGMGRRQAAQRAVELLDAVRMPDASRRAHEYPHQMSGGMRQRVMIAMAIACGPALLIADEPTTALDVTIQAQILDLLDALRHDLGMAILHITHDLGVVAQSADELLVMYAGRLVEQGPTPQVLQRPAHPYTLGLASCRPRLSQRRRRLPAIVGVVPEPWAMPAGCRFAARCPFKVQRCEREDPALTPVEGAAGDGRLVACFEAPRVLAAGRWPGADAAA